MKALKKKTRIALIVGAVVLVLLLVLLVVLQPGWIKPVLWTLLVVGLAFLALEGFVRWRRRKQQRAFDEKVSAKEGIDDRKREWSAWTEELDRQGLDRYELPFYLIVGEPQSGKSVLLQNSDLHFPFGQDRLSGVGGTRGCDWWFTDEAVILDIAGRLFTHEGGVADRMEWEAFLDLLYEFRPLCPANGILLVVPCDALAADSAEVSTEKANKIQNALLTLSQRVQAQLPVYLVLTKGDQVFGFSESVHKLDTKSRQEMFGWSRTAEDVDAPFDLTEAKSGFDTIVDRARLLRERMVASARIPEALPEVDRLYAFPDELAGIWSNLEIYLKRVFTESALIGSTSFRGIYLTSGLQTGVPVAKVCGELLGESGSGDRRALESLFTNQRAYFIKDLVRHRVFAERGLVRPTEGRVLRARRNAMLGYGAAAAVALLAIVGAIVHLASTPASAEERVYANALRRVEAVATTDPTAATALASLGYVHAALELEPEFMNEVFGATRDKFGEVYRETFDRRFVPALRRELVAKLEDATALTPKSFDEFSNVQDGVALALGELDIDDDEHVRVLQNWMPGTRATVMAPSQELPDRDTAFEFGLKEAIDRRLELGGDAVFRPTDAVRTSALPLAEKMLTWWNEALQGAPWQPRGEVGYMIAWRAQEDLLPRVRRYGERNGSFEHAMPRCAGYAAACDMLESLKQGGLVKIQGEKLLDASSAITKARARFAAIVAEGEEPDGWPEFDVLDEFMNEKMAGEHAEDLDIYPSPASFFVGGRLALMGNRYSNRYVNTLKRVFKPHATEVDRYLNDADLRFVCAAVPRPDWTPATLARELFEFRSRASKLGSEQSRIQSAKWRDFAEDLEDRFATWGEVESAFGAPDAASRLRLAGDLGSVRNELQAMESARDFDSVSVRIDRLLEGFLDVAEQDGSLEGTSGSFDWDRFQHLTSIAGGLAVRASLSSRAHQHREALLLEHLDDLRADWQIADGDVNQFLRAVELLQELVGELRENGLVAEADGQAPAARDLGRFTAWLAGVDADVSARLEAFATLRRAAWKPRMQLEAFEGAALGAHVEELFSTSELAAVRERVRSTMSPLPSDDALKTSRPVSATLALPRTRRAIESYATLEGSRDPFQFTSSEPGQRATALATFLKSPKGGDADQLAVWLERNEALAVLEPANEFRPTGAAELYADAIWRHLVRRCRDLVRATYLAEVASAVDGYDALDAVWAERPPTQAGLYDDQRVLEALDELMEPGRGRLARLWETYRMAVPGMQPSAQERADPAFEGRDWWRIEKFLRDLRTFFFGEGEEGTLLGAQLPLELSVPPGEAHRGLWNDNGEHPWTYYGTNANNKDEYGVGINDADGAKLVWRLLANQDNQFWIRWSSLTTWQPDLPRGDHEYRAHGVLAPLLLGWTGDGQASGRTRVVELMLEGDVRVPLQIKFGDSKERDLPVRPRLPKTKP